MSSTDLTDFIVALLHQIMGPRRRCRGHHGGQHHRRPLTAPPTVSTHLAGGNVGA
jgi:hypothetical protein